MASTEEGQDGGGGGGGGISLRNKFLVFVVFPTCMGAAGLYLPYLDKDKRETSFDKDFAMPFLLALAMVVVIYVQTNGFRQKEANPILKWPKVKRVKKVVYKKREKKQGEGGAEQGADDAAMAEDKKKQ